MSTKFDLTNQRFGNLVAIEYLPHECNQVMWKCRCDCGKYINVRSNSLRIGRCTSCTKCNACIFKFNETEGYYEGYFPDESKNINSSFSDFDMSIFEDDNIVLCQPMNIERNDIESLIFTKKPDFIVDKEYYNEIIKYNWYKRVRLNGNVEIDSKVDNRHLTLQRFIISLIDNIQLDDNTLVTFKDSARYDYRINNLLFTQRGDVRHRANPKNNSGYKGVTAKKKRFCARITDNGKTFFIGSFKTPEEAALAYNKKTKELFGKFAYQNVIKK